MNRVVLIGAGGHSKVIQDIVRMQKDYVLYAVLDDTIVEKTISNGVIFANTEMLHDLKKDDVFFFIAIGNNNIRKNLVERFGIEKERYVTLIHPNAVVSDNATIKNGSVVMANATINSGAKIGYHSIINTNAVIEHDNYLGSYVHISPGAVLAGTVSVESGTHIGAGAVVIPNQNIGEWSIVGAGATVINNIKENTTVVGSPAKIIKSNGMG